MKPATRGLPFISERPWHRPRKLRSPSIPPAVTQAAGLPFSKYALVVLSDLISVPASFESDLLKYVQTGGSVWVAARHFSLA